MEELLESEVMWQEYLYADTSDSDANSDDMYLHTRLSHRQANNSIPSSPIGIPRSASNSSAKFSGDNGGWCNEEEEFSRLVPPHVLVARRNNTTRVAFSLCSGQGRTLKGRDLQRLRSTVWRMTGFIDG
ncbi:protein S40-1-like [Carex rostrata]